MADIKRINRLVEILSIIDRRTKATPKGLAEHFGVSEQTIYRDMRVLVVDYPIRFDHDHGSYRFEDGFSLKKVDLSANEVRALLVSKAAVGKLGKGVAQAYESLLKKIKDEAGCKTGAQLRSAESPYWLDIEPVEDSCGVQKQFDMLQSALEDKNSLAITYKAMSSQEVSKRVIDPYGLFYSKGVWYVLAHCRLKEEIREFALDCIQDIKPTSQYYTIPKTFSMDDYFKTGWHIITYGSPVEVTIRFSENVARWIVRRKWHPSQKVEKNKDDSIMLKVMVSGTMELKRWLYQWGMECEVLSPPKFRKEVADELRAMANTYSEKSRPGKRQF